MEIKIGKQKIGGSNPVFIVAEAGVNHNGDIRLAEKLVDAAMASGANAIKFQSFSTGRLIRKDAPKARYQDINIGVEKSQYQMLKELELSHENTAQLKKYCDSKGIVFISTPYDLESVELLKKLGVSAYKLASMDVVHHSLVAAVATIGKPVILSTGMATEREVGEAVRVFRANAGSLNNLILLQCNTNYPALAEDQNLRVLEILKKYAPVVGYSDHTLGTEASIAAVVLGAKVIERHLTLDKKMKGPDHKASLNPNEFLNFIRSIRTAELALGNSKKVPCGGELDNISTMRRSICAKKEIPAGTIISIAHLDYKRPGNGLYPTFANVNKLVGRKTRIAIGADEDITIKKLEPGIHGKRK